MFCFWQAFGQTFIHDDLFLAVVGSCAAIFNALGRIFWGHIADRIAFKVRFGEIYASIFAVSRNVSALLLPYKFPIEDLDSMILHWDAVLLKHW